MTTAQPRHKKVIYDDITGRRMNRGMKNDATSCRSDWAIRLVRGGF